MIGKRNINKGIIAGMSGSTEKEVRLGRELAAQVDREAKFIDDGMITEYINRVGQNIVLHSDAKVPFTIKVIDSDEVNAFALPGGFFYVNKGLMLAADNEAELAGVMAHEIAHVAARHAVENNKKAELAQYAILIPSIIFGGGLGQLIYQGGGFASLLGFMKFTRGAEEEADKLGVQYMYAAGYDPTAMATMFEKLESKNKKKPGFISKLFATSPRSSGASCGIAGPCGPVSRERGICDQLVRISKSQGAFDAAFKCTRHVRGCFAGSGRRSTGSPDAEATSADTGRADARLLTVNRSLLRRKRLRS